MWLENSRNREQEDAVAAILCKAWNCGVLRNPDGSRIDRNCVRDGKLIGLCEIKCRNIATTTYREVWLEENKYLALQAGSRTHHVPAVWVVSFELDHTIRWMYSDTCGTYHRLWGGRTDRPFDDIDRMIAVPVAHMRLVS